MNESVTINILASDFKDTTYSESWNCAISAGFRRAGLPHIQHGAFNRLCNTYLQSSICVNEVEVLSNKVLDIYLGREEPKDIEMTLDIPEHFLEGPLINSFINL